MTLDEFAAKIEEHQRQVDACEHDFQPARFNIDLGQECSRCHVRELPWLRRRVAMLERQLKEAKS